MTLGSMEEKYIPRENSFYRNYYAYILVGLMLLITLMIAAVAVPLYQMVNRPLPTFTASIPSGEQMQLTPYTEPNLLPDTLLRFASKAATTAYTFDFYNYNAQIRMARPYFTDSGWQDYLNSVSPLIDTIVSNQLIVNGVVAGAPVIAREGMLPKGYSWSIQIPFLVTYQSANITTKRNFIVTVTVIRVPTNINPQGIGIDQFVM